MKKQHIMLMLLAILAIVACKETTTEETSSEETMETMEEKEVVAEPDYADYDKKVGIIRSFLKAHENEDLEKQRSLLSDTLRYSPAQYTGNQWQGKTEFLSALEGYHNGFDNIKFKEGIILQNGDNVGGMWSGSVYPAESASVSADAIRVYGTWTATHTESGKEIGVKYYSIVWVNADDKIASFSAYFDVNGIAAQLAAEE